MSYKLFNRNRQKEKKVSVDTTKIDNFRKALKINFPDNLREQIRRELEAEQNRVNGAWQQQHQRGWQHIMQEGIIPNHDGQFVWAADAPAVEAAAFSDEPVEDVNFEE